VISFISVLSSFPVRFVSDGANYVANDAACASHSAQAADGFETTRGHDLCYRMTEARYQDGFAGLAHAFQDRQARRFEFRNCHFFHNWPLFVALKRG
jgi:hypothetical protein